MLIGSGRVLENYNSILLASRLCHLGALSLMKLITAYTQTDTSLSSTETVIQNIYGNFTMAAMRSVSYLADIDYLAQGNLNSVTSRLPSILCFTSFEADPSCSISCYTSSH